MFRYAEDRLPIIVITLIFVLDLLVYASVDNPLWLFAWTLVGVVPKGNICAWNHHHQHTAVFKHAPLNRALELMYALQTGVTTNTWVLHHTIGHHNNYLDQELDESRWQDEDGGVMGVAYYTLWTGLTAYPRAWTVGRRYPKLLRQHAWMTALTLMVLALLIVARPLAALFVFVVPMIISLFITTWATHSHHAGNPTDSHFVACNNIIHRGYNIVTGNLGYHTAHHYKPGTHWAALPKLHAKIAHKIPDSCYLSPGFPWAWGQRPVAAPARDTRAEDAAEAEPLVEAPPPAATIG